MEMEKQQRREHERSLISASEGTSHWLVVDEAELPEGVRQRGFRKEVELIKDDRRGSASARSVDR